MTQPVAAQSDNVCIKCGACCATYRVSFYWAEVETTGLDDTFTEQLNAWYSCMRGTNSASPYCIALQGKLGEQVACAVYKRRLSPCRELQAGDDKCLRARAKHGLSELVDVAVE
jgi:hypothetical protein